METQSAPLTPPAPPRQDLTGINIMMLALLVPILYLVLPLQALLLAGLFLGLGFVLMAFRQPLWFMVLLALIAPFNIGQPLGGATIKISEVVTAVMAGLIGWRVAVLDYNLVSRIRRLAPPLMLFVVLGIWAVFTAFPHEHMFNVRYELQNYIAFAYGALFFRRSMWNGLTRGLFISLFMATIAALVLRFVFHISALSLFSEQQFATTGISAQDVDQLSGGRFRLGGTFGHKNMLAAFIILLLPLALAELVRRFSPLRLLGVLVSIAVLALTDSVTGWGALVMVLVLMFLHLRRFDLALAALLLAAPVGIYALFRFGEPIFHRLHQLLGTAEGFGTVSARFRIYEISFRLLRSHLWLGIGRNNFFELGGYNYPHAHNLYLMKLIEMGLPGGIVFNLLLFGILAIGFHVLGRHGRRLAAQGQYYRMLGLTLGCAGFMAVNCFDYSYSNFALGPLFMLCMGIMLAVALNLDAPPAELPAADVHMPPAPAARALQP